MMSEFYFSRKLIEREDTYSFQIVSYENQAMAVFGFDLRYFGVGELEIGRKTQDVSHKKYDAVSLTTYVLLLDT